MKIIDDEKIDPRIRGLPGYEEAKKRIELVKEYSPAVKKPDYIPPQIWKTDLINSL